MPSYEFECGDCGEPFEVRASFEEKDKGLNPTCPRCGGDNTGRILRGLVFFAKSGRLTASRRSGGCCCSPR